MASTIKQRRNNLLRALCHKFVREKMPEAYAILQRQAERVYRSQQPTKEIAHTIAKDKVHSRGGNRIHGRRNQRIDAGISRSL